MLPNDMRIADERAAARGCWLDEAAAERVRTFFRKFLRHSKGQFAGKPFELLDWQWEGVIRPLFGWRRPDGTRRFRRAYIEIPKKNGKSTLCAGIALYLLTKDNEPGAEVYSAAADRDQASALYSTKPQTWWRRALRWLRGVTWVRPRSGSPSPPPAPSTEPSPPTCPPRKG
jgi:phage terminase large subunit-like protein